MPRKKIQPLFEEPQKKEKPVKKEIISKTSTPKEEPIKKELPKKEIKKPEVVKKEIKPKITKTPPKKPVAKKEVVAKPKGLPKSFPKIKEMKIEEEVIGLPEENLSPVKKVKRKPKEPKKDPNKKINHKLKVGTRVIVTFLGQPTNGVIIELSEEGMYKVRSERGLVLPRAKHEEGELPDKRYPSYIIKVI
jgi:hypothetical protein